MKCLDMCKTFEVSCPNEDCRAWVDYEGELNCVFMTVEVNESLTLRECSQRLGISYVRVKQIEDEAIKKMRHLSCDFSN